MSERVIVSTPGSGNALKADGTPRRPTTLRRARGGAGRRKFRWRLWVKTPCGYARRRMVERRGRDLNPRRACTLNGFRDRPVRPLRHPSERVRVARRPCGGCRRRRRDSKSVGEPVVPHEPPPSKPRWDGEGGIRTLEAGITPPNALAGRRLQPLGHFSGSRQDIGRSG